MPLSCSISRVLQVECHEENSYSNESVGTDFISVICYELTAAEIML